MSLCECGCGGEAPIARNTNREFGWVKGMPIRFINHHHRRSSHENWDEGITTRHDGYIIRRRAFGGKMEHVLVAEKSLGKPLPHRANVHHVDENPSNNSPGNLVICQDLAYHKLIHRRMRAYRSCGNANLVRCPYCKTYDNPRSMILYLNLGRHHWRHRECQNEHTRMATRRKRAVDTRLR